MKAFVEFKEMPFPIPEGNLMRIGSATECEIRLPADPYLSRRHCSVSFVDNEFTIVDLRSSHGTVVNGLLLKSAPVTLHDGDQIRLGQTELTARLRD